jgi:hypothetical protein
MLFVKRKRYTLYEGVVIVSVFQTQYVEYKQRNLGTTEQISREPSTVVLFPAENFILRFFWTTFCLRKKGSRMYKSAYAIFVMCRWRKFTDILEYWC